MHATVITRLTVVLLGCAVVDLVRAQGAPGNGGGSSCPADSTLGQSVGTGCTSIMNCAGPSSNYVAFAQSSYAPDADGRFAAVFTTNFCPNNANTSYFSGVPGPVPTNAACCTQISLPATRYTSAQPVAAPLRGVIGYSLYGVQVFGPMEAGFTKGQACTNGVGTCDLGWDLGTCTKALEYQCGSSNVKVSMLADDCGGHASPYHYHARMRCEYNTNADSSGHSPLIALMLDGRGMYGQFESSGTTPADLDACGGHVGTTLSTTKNGATFQAAASVYHYHIVDSGPTTVGCFGPVASKSAAMALYSTCGAGFTNICTSKGLINFDTDCPIFAQEGAESVHNLNYTSTSTCAACSPNCPGVGASGSALGVHGLVSGLSAVWLAAQLQTSW